MTYEVLVVDDNQQAAVEFARLISVEGKLSAIATDDPEEAVNLVKSNPIKVALLDQRMPKRDGTALFADLIKIDPLLKAVMLTGEADADEVGIAMGLGFSDYIHKSQVDTIVPRVLLHYCSYHTDIAERKVSSDELVYSFETGPFWNRQRIDFFLISTDIINNQYVRSDCWKTIVKIDAGERTTRTISRQDLSRFVIENEAKDKLYASASAKIPIVEGLTAKLESTMLKRFQETVSRERTDSETLEREFRLPNEPENPNDLHVKSRQYEHAPVYQQIRMVIRKVCSFCNTPEILVVNANLLAASISTRQIDFMSNGETRKTDTGVMLS